MVTNRAKAYRLKEKKKTPGKAWRPLSAADSRKVDKILEKVNGRHGRPSGIEYR